MPKNNDIRQEKKKGLTDAELIAKYGQGEPSIPFAEMINVMLSKPNPNMPDKTKKQMPVLD